MGKGKRNPTKWCCIPIAEERATQYKLRAASNERAMCCTWGLALTQAQKEPEAHEASFIHPPPHSPARPHSEHTHPPPQSPARPHTASTHAHPSTHPPTHLAREVMLQQRPLHLPHALGCHARPQLAQRLALGLHVQLRVQGWWDLAKSCCSAGVCGGTVASFAR